MSKLVSTSASRRNLGSRVSSKYKISYEHPKERKQGVCMSVHPEYQSLAENKPRMGLKADGFFIFYLFFFILFISPSNSLTNKWTNSLSGPDLSYSWPWQILSRCWLNCVCFQQKVNKLKKPALCFPQIYWSKSCK